MKIGISLANYGCLPSTSFLKNAAQKIQHYDLDSIWLSDHIIVPKKDKPWTRIFEPISTLSFLSSITENISLGTSILLIPLRNPFVLAKQIATLDYLNNGDICIGAGIGWNKSEFDLLGINFKKRKTLFEKKIKIMKNFWKGYFVQQGYSCDPFPVSKNGPPILIGGNSQGALKRVAKMGDGWHPVGISSRQYQNSMSQITKIKKRNYIWTLRINTAVNKNLPSHYIGTDGSKRVRLSGNFNSVLSDIADYQKIGLNHLVCDIRTNLVDEYYEQLKLIGEIKKSI